jgi:hypothetical protein
LGIIAGVANRSLTARRDIYTPSPQSDLTGPIPPPTANDRQVKQEFESIEFLLPFVVSDGMIDGRKVSANIVDRHYGCGERLQATYRYYRLTLRVRSGTIVRPWSLC